MPDIVKFYLGEEPILKNVPTWRCREEKDLAYVLDNLKDLVVKLQALGKRVDIISKTHTRGRQRLASSPREDEYLGQVAYQDETAKTAELHNVAFLDKSVTSRASLSVPTIALASGTGDGANPASRTPVSKTIDLQIIASGCS